MDSMNLAPKRGGRAFANRPLAIGYWLCAQRRAFSLVELLTVISIIGILLAIGVGAAGIASRKMREARLRAELHGYTTAIEAYKAAFGHYPPDNNRDGTNANPAVNQLYYELVGTISDNQGGRYWTVERRAQRQKGLESDTFEAIFNVKGIVNSVPAPANKPRSFLPTVKAEQHKEVKLSPKVDPVEILVTPMDWPGKWPNNPAFPKPYDKEPKLKQVNPWRYVSTQPTNNPGSFDLWAEYVAGKQWRVLGNWKE
jgi:prepilin-type N-terminal cleavage/methylation domain-containing protein